MLSNETKLRKILVISLTNIGDVILTFPVIDILKENFPDAELSLVIGPKAKTLFHNNPHIKNIFIYNKKQTGIQSWRWVQNLKREKFDCVVDLRHTMIPFLLGTKQRTPLIRRKPKGVHMREKHLGCLKAIYPYSSEAKNKYSFFAADEDKKKIDAILEKSSLTNKKFVIVVPGAADPNKRWPKGNFARICDYIVDQTGINIVFVGSQDDNDVVCAIQQFMSEPSVNFSGQLNLVELGELMTRAQLVITNDSGPMHLASYLDKPTLAIFGPTDPRKYGPWSQEHCTIENFKECLKCKKSDSKEEHNCMLNIRIEEIIKCLKFEDNNISISPDCPLKI